VCLAASVALKDATSDHRLSAAVANHDVTSWLPSLTAPVTLAIGESSINQLNLKGGWFNWNR